jgi:hypothetical protein
MSRKLFWEIYVRRILNGGGKLKVIEGYMDLIIILAIMIIGMPLIVNLIYSCNRDSMRYLDDKSVIELSDYIEYVEYNGDMIPQYLVPPSTNYAGVVFLPLVQDVFQTETHDTALVPGYTWSTDFVSTTDKLDMPFENWEDYTVVRKAQFRQYWNQEISDNHTLRTSLNPTSKNPLYVKWYYIWNDELDRWILTDKVNLIYQKN